MPRFYRVVFDGTLAQGAERWSASVAYNSDAVVATPGQMGAWASNILGSMAASSGPSDHLKTLISASGSITAVRTYGYPDVGQPADRQGVSSGAAIPGAGTASLPPQCSCVVTLQTGLPGRSQRGRIYWPLCGGGVTVAQRSSLVTQTTANAFADLLANWGTLLENNTLRPVVASEATGNLTVVSSVRVDNIVDTQRRRRDNMVGTQFAASIP